MPCVILISLFQFIMKCQKKLDHWYFLSLFSLSLDLSSSIHFLNPLFSLFVFVVLQIYETLFNSNKRVLSSLFDPKFDLLFYDFFFICFIYFIFLQESPSTNRKRLFVKNFERSKTKRDLVDCFSLEVGLLLFFLSPFPFSYPITLLISLLSSLVFISSSQPLEKTLRKKKMKVECLSVLLQLWPT